jgi:hypothetical protein
MTDWQGPKKAGYSHLKASIGATLAARRPGAQQANGANIVNSNPTPILCAPQAIFAHGSQITAFALHAPKSLGY